MRIVLLLVAVAVAMASAYEGGCGTLNILQNKKKNRLTLTASTQYDSYKCRYEQYYDMVYSIETPHIQVFYVLNGPHATTKAFADSTAQSMEAAWKFYINQMEMRFPKGPKISYHFQQKVKDGLYPVEIIDIGQIRDSEINQCPSCYGLTLQQDNNEATQIFMDNDFFYGSFQRDKKDTLFVGKDTCIYYKSQNPLRNSAHNFSYTDEWAKGIRLTSFHEFYHAVQLRYLNVVYDNTLFWFEASATGFEEVTNPGVDDYFAYLPSFFSEMGIPLYRLSSTSNNKIYGTSTLFLYLYHKIAKDVDKNIWENYSKSPTQSFETQLGKSLQKYNLDADSVFHDYSVLLSLSGKSSLSIPQKEWINEDQVEWPSARFYMEDEVKPEVESLAFEFYRASQNSYTPDFTNFIGKASVITFNDGHATIHKIQNARSIGSLASALSSSDSAIWVFSRLGKSESIPIVTKDAPPHAFPVPWREGALCFAPLPRDKKFFEIRNRRGDLVAQQKYEGTSFCLQEDQVKAMMSPGVYRFRVGNKGKTSSFMVIY